jgi:hypothetical protein
VIPWPRRLRKIKPYTAEELTAKNCLAAARAILKENGGAGTLPEIFPPESKPKLGEDYPPSGGQITDWFDHRVVLIEGRYYDCMTGPGGMTEVEYCALFLHGDVIVFKEAVSQ